MSFILGSMLSEAAGGLLARDKENRADQAKLDLTAEIERMKEERALKARKAQASEIKQGVDSVITQRYGNQDNALTTDDVSPIRKPSRAEALQVRHDVASDLGYNDAATEARQARLSESQATYYESRPRLAEERLSQGAQRIEQGDRRLDQADELTDSRVDLNEARTNLANQRANAPATEQKITGAQKLKNMQIDAARKRIDGLSDTDIKRKTQQYTQTGRENPDYDPQLATRVRMANQRKMGDDPWFDTTNGIGQAEAPAPNTALKPVESVTQRFSTDPAMKGMRLGNQGPKGREVLDANGKLVGHYH
jgi:hypothetical protein